MFRLRLVLLSLVAVLSVGAMLASSASAAIKFEWKVGGLALAAGQSREFTTTSDGKEFLFKVSLAGIASEFLSSEVSVEPGAKIIGGKPGTNEETVVFKGVKVNKPANCGIESEGSPLGTIKTNALHTEIVESEGTHEPVILFSPKTGTTFVQLLFLNVGTEKCGGIGNILANLNGTFLAQPLPTLTETLNGDLDFEAPNSNFLLSNGTLDKAGLLVAGHSATFTGLELVVLKTDEKYGAF
jgi:hypothetical protein